ncbi:transmembrane protein, putative (macronuclear) [Tetrahymena thermophila SB210]|uniref:Transmembrane protein, putative n=1 Tax=Tetrahymena thermophila (strain SB210) TaxID=312017 RepID=Q23MQ8_TETTS|nr:transmembrane protein, putative [Tetrahymena thermophila SB210]EAR97784.2 transmembrane protein, putative [Tetrahymena thermophila SB210]|eukprot:XP_001018029.2 transmembrane protein, putative [Tetrahymena thermophila SB210]
MIYSKLDFFSSHFTFNTGNQQAKRGTLFGTMLSFSIFVITLSYFVYIIKQYINNQIEPTFRSQSFINNDLIAVPLNSDLVGFRFESGNQSTQSQDKTYLVYLAFFFYSSPNDNQFLPLNVIDCTNTNLIGFKCLDFSSVQNYTLALNTNQNIKSSVQILTYGCRDIDSLKTFVPNNCAEQNEIDSMINGINSVLRFKLYTSQYNTTSQRIEERYRNAQIFTIASQSIITQLKTQNQNTSIKQGLIIQSEQNFDSPIQYNQQDLGYDRQYALQQIGGGAYSVALIYIDEIVQQIQIQYPTLPQAFALVNGIFSLLMFTGILGRMVSQNSINKDLFLIFLKNIYQDSYLQIIKNTKKFQQLDEEVKSNTEEQNLQEQKQCDQESKSDKENQCYSPIIIPAFKNKQKSSLEQGQYNNSISNNIENIILNVQNNNQQNEQINNFMSQGAQNNINIKSNFITETESIIQSVVGVEQKSLQRDFLSNNSPQNASLMKFVLNKQSNFQQYQTKEKNSILAESSQVLIQNFNAIKNTKCAYKRKEDIPQKNFQKSEQKEGGISKLQLQKVEYQIKKDLNILNFIQDIILLKKAVMMILTKDQLAAMHLIGCSQSFLELNLSSQNCNLNQLEYSNKLSHYEMQLAISQSKKFQECIDTDQVKTTVPDNCASETDINNMINNINSGIEFKLFTSQYNTTSQQIQVNYRNAFINPLSTRSFYLVIYFVFISDISQLIILNFQFAYKLNNQQEQGLLVVLLFSQMKLFNTQKFNTSVPQVLAQIYTVFTLLMFLGVFGRQISKQFMNSELLMVFFKNLYLDNYLQILKSNNISNDEPLQQQPAQQLQSLQNRETQRKIVRNSEFDIYSQVVVPTFRCKQKFQLDQDQSCNLQNQSNNNNNNNNTLEPLKDNDSMTSSQVRQIQYKFNTEQQNPNIYFNNQEQDLENIFYSIVKPESYNSQPSQQTEIIQNESQKLSLSPLKKGKQLSQPLTFNLNLPCRNRLQKKINGLDPKEQNQIEEQIENDMDILNFFKDMLVLKKAIMLILTKEQLASLQLVGCSQQFLKLYLKNMEVGQNYQGKFNQLFLFIKLQNTFQKNQIA